VSRNAVVLPVLLAGLALALAGCPKSETNPSNPAANPEPAAKPEPKPAEPTKSEPTKAEPTKAEALPEKPIVELSTSLGKLKLELFPKKAPKTVANFLRYVRAGHYSGTVFHRVIPTFMIQGGGFDSSLKEKPTSPPIENEADNGLTHERGTLAMARTPNPHSASAQFFINTVTNSFLNHREKSMEGWGYCVFGKVVEGMEVVDKIKDVQTGPKGPFDKDVPQTDVVINEVKLLP
jgi:peptidyl-prolyl cis-trans isomerase A (cyclophilin A)/peptidyl-prolyl cis-trans isomerase B (cyclophilin B)